MKRLAGSEGEPTDALLRLSLYYGFGSHFCDISSGNEKGHVKRSVGSVRRNAFAHRDTFDSLNEANSYLLKTCFAINNKPRKGLNHRTAMDVLEDERAYLLPGLPKYDAARVVELRVNKYSVITVDSCYYSVPDKYVNKLVLTKIYSNEIRCFYEGIHIATHARKMGFNLWSIELEHYLNTLKRKPGALFSSVALRQADPRLKEIYNRYFISKEKDFIDLLFYISEHGLEEVEKAIDLIKETAPLEISIDMIKAICNRNTQEEAPVVIDDYTSQIEGYSKEMLTSLAGLTPKGDETFSKEVRII